MLPTGHLAGGYLVSASALQILEAVYHIPNETLFLVIGLTASVIPDLDEFAAFAKIGGFIGGDGKISHRKFFTHAPILHAVLASTLFIAGLFGGNLWIQIAALMYLLGTMTHFFLDSFAYGIMWLWPFTKKVYAFRLRERNLNIQTREFFPYWITFLKLYARDPVAWAEIAIIAAAVIVYFKF